MVTLVSVFLPLSFCSDLTVGGLEGCSGGLIGRGAGKWEVGGGGGAHSSDSAT